VDADRAAVLEPDGVIGPAPAHAGLMISAGFACLGLVKPGSDTAR